MIILQDSQIKKIFHNGDEVKKILDWDGNVIFYKQSGGGGMTNDIKFHTTSAVTSSLFFKAIYTDYTSDSIKASEPNKQYTLPIQSGKTVKSLDFEDSLVDEVIVSCKIDLSKDFFYKKPKTIRIINCDATSSTSLANLFRGSTNIETIEMKDLDVRNVTNMSYMFNECSGATTIGISNWNTSSVTNLSNVFDSCKNVAYIDLSSWDTSNATTMYEMFQNCTSLVTLDLSAFNTSKVTEFRYMFWKCNKLTSLDISGWNITNAENTNCMFCGCKSLKTIRMIGCNQTTIDIIKSALRSDGINNVTIVTE